MNDQKNEQCLTKTHIAELEAQIAANDLKIAQFEQRQKSTPTSKEQKSFSLMTYEEQRADLIKNALPGKCSVRFIEREEFTWEGALLRDHESCEEAIKNLTATTDSTLATEIFTRGSFAIAGKKEGKKANIAAQALADNPPQDSIEAKLTLQANALYSQGMAYLYRAEQENMITQCEFYIKNAMKLLRLHNETVEALCKYKRRGEQRVVVQHVNVEGQAIVNNGNMIAGGGRK